MEQGGGEDWCSAQPVTRVDGTMTAQRAMSGNTVLSSKCECMFAACATLLKARRHWLDFKKKPRGRQTPGVLMAQGRNHSYLRATKKADLSLPVGRQGSALLNSLYYFSASTPDLAAGYVSTIKYATAFEGLFAGSTSSATSVIYPLESNDREVFIP
jgi:hypothetical protein